MPTACVNAAITLVAMGEAKLMIGPFIFLVFYEIAMRLYDL
ncbi:MAG: hypothetical protein AAF699_21695 [Pseudomonadota bacterium]